MKHFGIIQWVDFARGVAPPDNLRIMETHLAGGCAVCSELAGFCRKLAAVCGATALHPIPEDVLRQAHSLFPARRTVPARPSSRLPVELIFDSLLAPAPAGLRSSWQVGWQALYRSGDCSLDLRVEPELHSSRAAIIGQVSSHAAPDSEMSGLPVCLKVGKIVAAETRSNRYGEFQMEYQQQKRLQLCIALEGGSKTLRVPVKWLASDTTVDDALKLSTRPSRKRPGLKG